MQRQQEFNVAIRKQQRRRRWKKLVSALVCIVVFCTTYALILPAITISIDDLTEVVSETGDGTSTSDTTVLPLSGSDIGTVECSGLVYNSETGDFDLDLTLIFTLSKDQLKYDVCITLPSEVMIPDSMLGKTYSGKDLAGTVASYYWFEKVTDADGTYYVIHMEFLEDYVEKVSDDTATCKIEFEGSLTPNTFDDETGNLVLKWSDNATTTIKREDITYPEDETYQYDVSVSKSGSYDSAKEILSYTVTVESTKGTPSPLTVTDKLTYSTSDFSLGNLTGLTVVDSDNKTLTAGTGSTDSDGNDTVTSGDYWIKENKDGTFTIIFNDGLEAKESYTITYSYPVSGVDAGAECWPTNEADAVAEDTDTKEKVGSSATAAVKVYNEYVLKSGSYDTETDTITWTITVNPDGKNIAGYTLRDDMLAQRLSLQISPSTGYTVNADNSIIFNAVNGTENTNTYTITYTTKHPQTTASTAVTNTAVLKYGDTTIAGNDNTYTVTVPADTKITKSGTLGDGTISWKVTVTVPDGGIGANTVITDVLGYSWGANEDHWMQTAQLNALYEALCAQFDSADFTLEFSEDYYTWESYAEAIANTSVNQYYYWCLTFNTDIEYSGEALEISYITKYNADAVTGDKTWYNYAKIGNLDVLAQVSTKPILLKTDSNGNTGTTTITNSDGTGTVAWYIRVTPDDGATSITVTDDLPAGLTLTKVGVCYSDSDAKTNVTSTEGEFKTVYNWRGNLQFQYSTAATTDDNGTKTGGTIVTVDVAALAYNDTWTALESSTFPEDQDVYIYIECSIDQLPDPGSQSEYEFKNEATYKHAIDGTKMEETSTQTQIVTVNMPEKVTKTDSDGKTDDTTIVYSGTDDQTLGWYIEIYLDQKYENSIVVEDYLPDGVTLTKVGVATSKYNARYTSGYVTELGDSTEGTKGSNKVGSYAVIATNHSHDSACYDSDDNLICKLTDQTLTVTIPADGYAARTTIYVYVEVTVPAEDLTAGDETVTHTYKNTVNVDINSADYGVESSQTQTVTVNSKKTSTIVNKLGAWSRDDQEVQYQVLINSAGDDLATGKDTITVTDVLSYTYYTSDPLNSTLVKGSVKLYQAVTDGNGNALTYKDANGNDRYVLGDEVTDWSWTYSDNFSSLDSWGGTLENTITATVPDSTPLILVYSYAFSYSKEGEWKSVSNTVTVKGDAENSASNNEWWEWKDSQTSATISTAGSYTVYKVQSGNYNISLPGAVFTVYTYPDNQQVATYTTDSDGIFSIAKGSLDYNQVYYFVETSAPDGYDLPETPTKYYFYWSKTGDGYTALTDIPSGAIDLSANFGVAYVANEVEKDNTLTINKQWQSTSTDGIKYIHFKLIQTDVYGNVDENYLFTDKTGNGLYINPTGSAVWQATETGVAKVLKSSYVIWDQSTNKTLTGEQLWEENGYYYFNITAGNVYTFVLTSAATDDESTEDGTTEGESTDDESTASVVTDDAATGNLDLTWFIYQDRTLAVEKTFSNGQISWTADYSGSVTVAAVSGITGTITVTRSGTTVETASSQSEDDTDTVLTFTAVKGQTYVLSYTPGSDDTSTDNVTVEIALSYQEYLDNGAFTVTNAAWTTTVVVPEKDSEGNAYTYTVQEVAVDWEDNATKTEFVSSVAYNGNTITITNQPKETKTLTVEKEWATGLEPEPVTIQLYQAADTIYTAYTAYLCFADEDWNPQISIESLATFTTEIIGTGNYSIEWNMQDFGFQKTEGVSVFYIDILDPYGAIFGYETDTNGSLIWDETIEAYKTYSNYNLSNLAVYVNGEEFSINSESAAFTRDGDYTRINIYNGGTQLFTNTNDFSIGEYGTLKVTFRLTATSDDYAKIPALYYQVPVANTGGTPYGDPITLSSDNKTYTWSDLPETGTDANGNLVYYSYYVVETTKGYDVTYSNSSAVKEEKITVTNTSRTPIDLTVKKSWADASGKEIDAAESSVSFDLYTPYSLELVFGIYNTEYMQYVDADLYKTREVYVGDIITIVYYAPYGTIIRDDAYRDVNANEFTNWSITKGDKVGTSGSYDIYEYTCVITIKESEKFHITTYVDGLGFSFTGDNSESLNLGIQSVTITHAKTDDGTDDYLTNLKLWNNLGSYTVKGSDDWTLTLEDLEARTYLLKETTTGYTISYAAGTGATASTESQGDTGESDETGIIFTTTAGTNASVTITNASPTTQLTVEKIWLDNGEHSAVEMRSFVLYQVDQETKAVKAYGTYQMTPDSEGNWTLDITDLPWYYTVETTDGDGNTTSMKVYYSYYIQENPLTGYRAYYSTAEGKKGTTTGSDATLAGDENTTDLGTIYITNEAVTSIGVQKVWAEGTAEQTVTIQLYQVYTGLNGTFTTTAMNKTTQLGGDSTEGDHKTFKNLPLYAFEDGAVVGYYSYFVVETTEGYNVTYSNSGPITSGEITVTNTALSTSVTVIKEWVDDFVQAKTVNIKLQQAVVPHTHDDTSWTVEKTVAATCSENGYTVYKCSVCGATKTELSGPTDHSWEVDSETAATCTAGGSVTYKCKTCGETKTVYSSATGHSWGDWDITKEATCTEAGSKTRTCSTCDETETVEIPATEHKWGDGATQEDGSVIYTCTVCSATKTETCEHEWDDGVLVTTSTDEKCCYTIYTCSLCGATKYSDTQSHKAADAVVENEVAAAETEDGSYDSVVYCSICGSEISRDSKTIPATGSSGTENTLWTLVSGSDTTTDEITISVNSDMFSTGGYLTITYEMTESRSDGWLYLDMYDANNNKQTASWLQELSTSGTTKVEYKSYESAFSSVTTFKIKSGNGCNITAITWTDGTESTAISVTSLTELSEETTDPTDSTEGTGSTDGTTASLTWSDYTEYVGVASDDTGYTWSDLPMYAYDGKGNFIGYYVYRVVEENADDYGATYTVGNTVYTNDDDTWFVTGGTVTVTNTPIVTVLPATGGTGTSPYTLGGLALLIGAAFVLLYNRKKSRKGAPAP